MFVDYAGQTVPVVNRDTGELREAQIFVAALGASSYTFARAVLDPITARLRLTHTAERSLFSCGVTETLVPDNATKPASPTRTATSPSSTPPTPIWPLTMGSSSYRLEPAKPRDKAKVEVAVQVVERWILARLRHQTFFNLDDLNRTIAELLVSLNERAFKKLPGSRRTLFEERTTCAQSLAFQPLRLRHLEESARQHRLPHRGSNRHYYSVPYQLVKLQLDARISAHTVELFNRGKRVASHRSL